MAARIGIFQPATVRWHRHDVKLMSCHKEGEIFAMQSQPKLYEVKFIYSEKATNFCEISTVDLSYVVTVKSTVEISQNFVDFSEIYEL